MGGFAFLGPLTLLLAMTLEAVSLAQTPTQAPAPAPAPSAVRPAPIDFVLETTAGSKRALSSLRGRVAVIFYEDRHHTETNARVKEALGRLNASLPAAERFAFVPVANLKGLDFFPAQGFARSAVKDAAAKNKLEIWMDWDGAAGRRLGFHEDDAYVAVIDTTGAVRFRARGALGEEQQRALAAAIASAR